MKPAILLLASRPVASLVLNAQDSTRGVGAYPGDPTAGKKRTIQTELENADARGGDRKLWSKVLTWRKRNRRALCADRSEFRRTESRRGYRRSLASPQKP